MFKHATTVIRAVRAAATPTFQKSRLLPLVVLLNALSQQALAQTLPEDPGIPGLRTLAGIDSNGDGVRDDIERYIATHFKNEQELGRAVSNLAIAFQHAVAATSVPESRRAQSMVLYASECAVALGTRVAAFANELQALSELMENTPERTTAFKNHLARIEHDVFVVRNDPEWDDNCAKRVDQVNGGKGWPPSKE